MTRYPQDPNFFAELTILPTPIIKRFIYLLYTIVRIFPFLMRVKSLTKTEATRSYDASSQRTMIDPSSSLVTSRQRSNPCRCTFKEKTMLLIARRILVMTVISSVYSLDVRPRLPGLWTLTTTGGSLPRRVTAGTKLEEIFLQDPQKSQTDENIVILSLSDDGSFKRCCDSRSNWFSGLWDLSGNNQLILAFDRTYHRDSDFILEGCLQEREASLSFQGSVCKGKFMYPQSHPSFFDKPLVEQHVVGTFQLRQTLSEQTIAPVRNETVHLSIWGSSNFYGRSFYMIVEPLWQKNDRTVFENADNDQPVDIRAMPIQFFSNCTFQALGVNKILRGRFAVQDDVLSFEVSLFGAGRSMKGSVYSEGVGLSHEDKRSYLGTIQEEKGRLFVDGTVTFGSDLGTDARPEPVGRFHLSETKDADSLKSMLSGLDDGYHEDEPYSEFQ